MKSRLGEAMKTLSLLLMTWAFLLGLLSFCAFVVPFLPLKIALAALVLVQFGSLIPVTAEEAGFFFSYYLKLYPLGMPVTRLAGFLYKVPTWNNPNYTAFVPMNLAVVNLVRGNKKEAAHFAREALSVADGAEWRVKSRCLTVIGEVLYHNGLCDEAKTHLLLAEEIFRENEGSFQTRSPVVTDQEQLATRKASVFAGLNQEMNQYYAKCLDLLGLLFLKEGNEGLSSGFFAKGVSIRRENYSLEPASKAYKVYVEGLKLLHQGKKEEAEAKFMEAASLLPEKIRLMQDHYVLVLVGRALSEINSSNTIKVKSGIKKVYKGKLHPFQFKLLDVPILS